MKLVKSFLQWVMPTGTHITREVGKGRDFKQVSKTKKLETWQDQEEFRWHCLDFHRSSQSCTRSTLVCRQPNPNIGLLLYWWVGTGTSQNALFLLEGWKETWIVYLWRRCPCTCHPRHHPPKRVRKNDHHRTCGPTVLIPEGSVW